MERRLLYSNQPCLPVTLSLLILPHDVPCRFIIAKPEIPGVAEFSVRGPLGEHYFAHKVRGDEVLPFFSPWFVCKRGGLQFPGGKVSADLPERTVIKSAPHPAGIEKAAVLVISQEEGPEPWPAPSRVGVPAYDELLLVEALELEPVG